MNYDRLDDILTYLKNNNGYKMWIHYRDYCTNKSTPEPQDKITFQHYVYWCNTLKEFGLVDYERNTNRGFHTYSINYKGEQLIDSGKSTKDVHKEVIKKEKLESAILKSNAITPILTFISLILSVISLISLFHQYEANKIAKQNLEIAEKTYQAQFNSIPITHKQTTPFDTTSYKINKKQK